MFRFDKYVNIVHHVEKVLCNIAVTPFVGVWIEMYADIADWDMFNVTPFVGVWIEINGEMQKEKKKDMSLPSWECGLKSAYKPLRKALNLSLPSWECGLK